MGLFDLFKKRRQSKLAASAFGRLHVELEGRRLADEAFSYRNLGEFDKAIELLVRALEEFQYSPAVVLIGTTLEKKGDIEGAMSWFKSKAFDYADSTVFPQIEIFANIGHLYVEYFHDAESALQMYFKALEAPRPHIFEDNDAAYFHMEINVIHDMAIAFAMIDSLQVAYECAIRHLDFDSKCNSCRKIIELYSATSK